MVREEQNVFLSREYAEAVRYMDNAREMLQKAKKRDDGFYTDKKYVRTACGTAYSGVLVALDAWFTLKGVKNPKKNGRKSVDFYKMNLSQLDKKMADYYDTVYGNLHLCGYYDGRLDVDTIQSGFRRACEIIEKIKPEHPVEVRESRADGMKRALNILFISAAVMLR
ncbi:MAG: DUF5618 family protein [Chitinispirillia bacterium]|nr:DUF5618 family protein [Chitinispirillia bacterium]MCL2269512.1 DUF5618 family protein [Chitinispirillia bacterium]